MPDYYLCDWRVRSEVVIPELVDWTGDDREPDVVIRLGKAPELEPGGEAMSPFMGINPDGSVRIHLEDAATMLVSGGRDVIVSPLAGVESNGVRILILGAVLAILCHQRGLFPLHASCVRWGDGAVAFAGHSGAGKSTLAAGLRSRGYPVLSDDVCALEVRDGQVWVRPAFPRVKLWPDSMEIVGLPMDGEPFSGDQKNKFHFRFTEADAFEAQALPLKAIYLINQAEPGAPAQILPPGTTIETIMALNNNVARRPLALAMGLQAKLFGIAGDIARAVPVLRLVRCAEPARMDETLAVLQATL